MKNIDSSKFEFNNNDTNRHLCSIYFTILLKDVFELENN